MAKGCIDPRAAVTLLESFAAPREFSATHPVHSARLRLAAMLGLPPEERWSRLWASVRTQLPLDD